MAVQKKKKPNKQVNKSKVFLWTDKRKAAALLLSTGTKTQRDVCEEINITEKTMCEWKKFPVFLEEIERLTLKNENFTRAGLLKECLKGLTLKMGNIEEDRSTHLDYIKAIAELQGMTKQKIEFDNVTPQQIPRTPAVIDAEYELLKAITTAEKDTKTDEQP